MFVSPFTDYALAVTKLYPLIAIWGNSFPDTAPNCASTWSGSKLDPVNRSWEREAEKNGPEDAQCVSIVTRSVDADSNTNPAQTDQKPART